ncbi:MAG: hypothetical protein IKL78_03145 [Lachnospiraceae bacterium]|nr:hypothetical protein [Lachnospiraceae bacterium]
MKKKLSFPLEIIITVLFLLVILAIWPGKILYRTTIESASVEKQMSGNIPLTEGSTVIAEFVPTYDLLNGLSFKLDSNGGQSDENGSVELKVYDDSMREIASSKMSIGSIQDRTYQYFYLNTSVTPGKTYYYTLESKDYGEYPVILYSGSQFTGSPEYRSLCIDGTVINLAPDCIYNYYAAPPLRDMLPAIIGVSLIGLLTLLALRKRHKDDDSHKKSITSTSGVCIGLFALILFISFIFLGDESNKPLVVAGENMDKEYGTRAYGTIYITEDTGYTGLLATSDTYALPKGEYTFGLEYQSGSGNDTFTIWTNHEELATYTLDPSIRYQTFRFSLDKDTEEVKFTFNYGGKGTCTLTNYTLTADNGFYQDVYLYIGLVILGFVAFYGYAFYCKKKNYRMEVKAKQTHIILLLVSFAASLPLMTTELSWGDDIAYHLVRIEGIKDGLRDGQFPVMIYPEGMDGHGYLNAMYPNLFLYIPAVLRLMGVSIVNSYKALLILSNVATVYLTYYAIRSITKERKTAILAATVYALAPYHFTNLYARAALGEALAMAFLPLMIAGLYHVIIGQKKYWWMLAIGLTGLLESHILSAFLGILLCVIAGIIYIVPLCREKRIFTILKAAGLTILLNLGFIVPFLYYYMNGNLYDQALGWSSFYEYSIYFSEILGNAANNHYRAMTLGVPVAIMLILSIVYLVEKKKREDANESGFLLLLTVVTGIVLFMTTCHFAGKDLLSIAPFNFFLKNVQFPWRLLGIVTALGILIGSIAMAKSALLTQHKNIITIVLMVVVLLASTQSYSENMPYPVHTDTYTSGHESKVIGIQKGENTIVYPWEWRPAGMTDSVVSIHDILVPDSAVEILSHERSGTKTTVTYRNSEEDMFMLLPITYYYGYEIVDEKGNEVPFEMSSTGLIQLDLLNDGIEHTYIIEYKGSFLFTGATLVSIGTVIGWIVISLLKKRKVNTVTE